MEFDETINHVGLNIQRLKKLEEVGIYECLYCGIHHDKKSAIIDDRCISCISKRERNMEFDETINHVGLNIQRLKKLEEVGIYECLYCGIHHDKKSAIIDDRCISCISKRERNKK